MEIWIESLLAALALPKFGLSTVFIVSLISATLLPLGSEPAVFGLLKLDPTLFWPAVGVATVGNTLGGAISWWMGFGAEKAWEQVANRPATVRICPEKTPAANYGFDVTPARPAASRGRCRR